MNLLATLHRCLGSPASGRTRLARPLAALGLLLATAGAAQAQTTTFAFTGSPQTYTVPAGVTRLQVVAVGGSGGTIFGTPARGAQVAATVAVTPGEALSVFVGGQGGSNLGGYNGGGTGGGGGSMSAGGGGGATDLRRSSSTDDYLTTRKALVVAGGGGGNFSDNNGLGGRGGVPNGGDGTGQSPGQGATQQRNGVIGGGSQAGNAGYGGNGVVANGGGGGGGYYGGGGGGYYGGGGAGPSSGGGGSSFVTMTGSSNISYSVATAAGNGSLTITPLYAPTITSLSPSTGGAVGSVLTITGTNLGGATSVRFGELPAPAGSFSVNPNGNQLTVTVPVLASTNKVSVTTPGGVALSADYFQVSRASAAGTFTAVGTLQVAGSGELNGGGNGFAKPVLTDLDGDGLLDLLVGNQDGAVYRYEQTGPGLGTFADLGPLAGVQAGGRGSATPTVTDLDGDGLLDLLVGNDNGSVTRFEQTAPNAGFGAGMVLAGVNVSGYAAPTVADLDGNGLLDLLVGNFGNTVTFSTVTRYEQNAAGSGTFTSRGALALNTGDIPSLAPVLTDLDGDGRLDLLVGNINGPVQRFVQDVPAPTITSLSPTPNAVAAAPTSAVQVTFSQPLAAGSAGALQVFSSQRGGRRTTAMPATVSGNQLRFAPGATPFRPGETVQATVTTAAQSSAGANLAAPYVFQFTTATTSGGGAFGPKTDYATGGPVGVAVGDVNNDGNLDLVTADRTNSTVSVRLGNGQGGFGASTSFTSNRYSGPVALGDLNGDGNLDIVVGYSTTNSSAIGVLLGRGTGSFQAYQEYSINQFGTVNFALGDVNGDGRLDAVTANFQSGNVSVLLGTGTGALGGPTTYAIGSGTTVRDVALGDVNGDGQLDIVAVSDNAVSVLPGTGGGSFGAKTDYPAASPSSVALGDVNGDGQLDIVTQSSVRLGTGTGTFGAATPFTAGGATSDVALSDVNGDGRLDIVASGGNTVAVLTNTGAGSFGPPATYPTTVGVALALGDVNNDGRPDAVTAGDRFSSATDFASVLLNVPPTPTITSFTPTSGPVGTQVTLTGTNFTNVTAVAFNGTAASSFTVNSATSITATVATGTTTGAITVTTPGGTASTSGLTPAVFTVQNVPTLATALRDEFTTSTTATLGGNTLADGGSPITEKGVVYVPAPGTPSLTNGTKVAMGSGTPDYLNQVAGLTPGTTYAVRAYATNAVGTGYGDLRTFTTPATPATQAPVVQQPADGSFVNTTRPTYSGTAPNSSTVTVYVDGQAVGTATARSNGVGFVFSFQQPAGRPLSEGPHQVYATAQSSGATVSPNSNTNRFTVDTVAPTVTSLTSTAGASGSSTGTTPFAFSVSFSEAVTGFAASGITVTNGTVSSSPSGSGAGPYTFQVTPTTAGTATTVTIAANAAQDAAGNGSAASAPYTLTYLAPIAATIWTGSVSTDWFTAGNWTAGVPTATVDALVLVVSTGRYPLIGTGTASVKNLTLASGASLTQTGGTLALSGNLTNNGTLAATGGTVATTNMALQTQTLGGSSPLPFFNLSVGPAGASQATSVSFQGILSLTGNLTTNGQALTLLSRVSGGVAQDGLVVNSSGVVVGTATVQRAIDPSSNQGVGYRHYSAPVSSSTVADLATAGFTPVVNPAYNSAAMPNAVGPFPTMYGYNDSRLSLTNNLSSFDKGFFSPATTGDPLAVGRGYTVNIRASELVDFQGTLNNGDRILNLTSSRLSYPDGGWQLLGNPYPAPLDYSQVLPADRMGLEAALYVYHSTGPYVGQYRSYVNGIGNPVLPVGQGYFARVAAGFSTATMTFRNSQRLTAPNGTPFQRTAADPRPLVQLTLQGTGSALLDEATVYFESGASSGFEAAFDAEKLPNPTGLNLATSLAGGRRLSIDGQAELGASQRVVPLAVGVPTAGVYTFTASQLLNLSAVPVYLRDAQLGTLIDLRQQPTYQFTVGNAAALNTTRFELVFSPQQLLATVPAALAQQVALYPNPAKTQVTLELPAALGRQPVTAALLDALGRVVRQQVLPAGLASHALSLAELTTGVYSLRLITTAGVVVKKLVIE